MMTEQHPFKWRHFQSDIILLCVRWYLRYSLSYRDLEEIMQERGLSVDHTTIFRWVQHYGPELEKRSRPYLKTTTDSWRVDETYIKIKGVWTYLYRAVDSAGNTLDFWLSATRGSEAAKRFFTKAFTATHTVTPCQGFTPPLFRAHLEVEYLCLAHGTKDGVHPGGVVAPGQPLHTASPNLG